MISRAPGLLLVSLAAALLTVCHAAPDAPATPVDPARTVAELAAIERRGADFANMSLQEILRDSAEAKKVNELRAALARAGTSVTPLLAKGIVDCKRPGTLRILLDALADFGSGKVPPEIPAIALDRRVDVVLRRQIPRFLGRVGDASHAATLEKLAYEPDFKIAQESVFALGSLAGRSGVPALYRVLESKHDVSRGAAAEAMGEIDELAAVPKLIERLLDPDPYVRTFAQGSLTELTYHYTINRPNYAAEQHQEWTRWWAANGAHPRERLLQNALADCLLVLSGQDTKAALDRAAWLAELSFQEQPNEAFFLSPLGGVAQGMESVRWREWVRLHGEKGRVEWFRQAIDRAIAQLENLDPASSWHGLTVLNELLALPSGEPYLFRAAWVRETPEARLELARVYLDWWKQQRSVFSPVGKKYW